MAKFKLLEVCTSPETFFGIVSLRAKVPIPYGKRKFDDKNAKIGQRNDFQCPKKKKAETQTVLIRPTNCPNVFKKYMS